LAAGLLPLVADLGVRTDQWLATAAALAAALPVRSCLPPEAALTEPERVRVLLETLSRALPELKRRADRVAKEL